MIVQTSLQILVAEFGGDSSIDIVIFDQHSTMSVFVPRIQTSSAVLQFTIVYAERLVRHGYLISARYAVALARLRALLRKVPIVVAGRGVGKWSRCGSSGAWRSNF